MRTALALLSCSLLLASCGPRQEDDIRRIDELRASAEQLVKAEALMQFQSWAAGAPSNQDSLYQAYAALFTLENIALVRRAEDQERDPVQKQRLRYFRRYLSTEYITKATAALTDRAANLEAAATILVRAERVPYRQLPVLLANEKDPARRADAYRAADPVLDSLNVLLRRVEESSTACARELGSESYTALATDLKGFSLEAFSHTADEVLDATDSLYRVLLREQLAQQLRVAPDAFAPSDVAVLFRNQRFDRSFPAAGLLPTAKRAYKQLGIDLDAQRNLRIDAADRPAKNPRAACFAIDVPNDIRLSIKPIGGADDYAALFHEMGHAEHYANTKEHAFEFCYAGEPTVTESYAFLSEYLLENQAWLRLHSAMPAPTLQAFVRFAAFHRLWYVRRYCAKFLYELQLHAGAANAPALYASLMSRATAMTLVPSLEKRFLSDVDAMFYSASYLRAWFLEAQLNERLTKDHGPNWFEYPGAGEFVRSLWARGDRIEGDELARMLGSRQISPDAWLAEIRAMVLFSTP